MKKCNISIAALRSCSPVVYSFSLSEDDFKLIQDEGNDVLIDFK